MKQRLFAVCITFMMLLSMALPMAMASETEETTAETTEETSEETRSQLSTETSGSCGKNMTWQLDGHTLVITGSGEMDDGCPWIFYKDSILSVILQGEITSIGEKSFYSCNNLQYVDFGSSLKEIGAQAFYSCNALEAIRLPATFRKFGAECFRDCDNLQLIYCDGPMPSFKPNCLYTNHTVSIYYSAFHAWPQEEIDRLYANFGKRLYLDIGSPEALDAYWDDVEIPSVSAQTEPAPTEPAETEPVETEPVPVPTQPEPTVPPTTLPPVTLPAETVMAPAADEDGNAVLELAKEDLRVEDPTEAAAQEVSETEEPAGFSGWVWILIAAAGITGLLVIALLIRMVAHSSGRYSD